jgi:hypothetical protein
MKIIIKTITYLGNATMLTVPSIIIAGLLGVAGFSDVCFAKAKSKSAPKSIYMDSFSKPEVDAEETPSVASGAPLEVPSLNSFPVRVQVEGSDVNGWEQPDNVAMPSKISKTFKINNCQFDIKGGDFSVRQYNPEFPDQLQVLADAVMPLSTFSSPRGGQVLFSVTTSLSISIDEKNKVSCREAIGSKMLYIGRASLDGSILYAVGASGEATNANANVFKQENPGKLFISWDSATNQIALADHLGMIPEIESNVYTFSFDAKDTFYLGFDQSFKLIKDKNKVAKK